MNIILFTACTNDVFHKQSDYCSVNKSDKLRYLHYFTNFDFRTLKNLKHSSIQLPIPYPNYIIHSTNFVVYVDSDFKQDDINLSICPPRILKNGCNESCLVRLDFK